MTVLVSMKHHHGFYYNATPEATPTRPMARPLLDWHRLDVFRVGIVLVQISKFVPLEKKNFLAELVL